MKRYIDAWDMYAASALGALITDYEPEQAASIAAKYAHAMLDHRPSAWGGGDLFDADAPWECKK